MVTIWQKIHIHLLEANIDKISWNYLSFNPNIFTYDYDTMQKQME
jgi:hypothetical protein